MLYIPTATRSELEVEFLVNDDLMAKVDEQKFMASGYSDDELRIIVQAWIEEAPDA